MEKLILTEVEVEAICEKLAHEMDKQMDKDESNLPILLGIMNGALPFMYQLVKSIKHPNQIDTMQVSSYNGTASTGELIIKKKPERNLEGKDVYIIEDIIDSGMTMAHMIETLEHQNPASISVCSLLVKPDALKVEIPIHYRAMDIPNDFIVGYGLDYDGFGRNTKDIYTLIK